MQRAVVADTSPLNYLVSIDLIGCLAGLFGRIVIPTAVKEELKHPRAPERVREWISSPPCWLVVHPDPIDVGAELDTLDEGERKAIKLAHDLSADLIIVDDRIAAEIARRRGLAVTGTLGIIQRASARSLLDLPSAIDRLRATSFRCRPGLLDEVLQAHWRGTYG